MTSPPEAPIPGTREHFAEVTKLRRWGTIQEYVELCRTQGYFTATFYQKAVAHMERIHVRRLLRQVTDGRGWPTLANIVRAGERRPARARLHAGGAVRPGGIPSGGGLSLRHGAAPPGQGTDLPRAREGAVRAAAATLRGGRRAPSGPGGRGGSPPDLTPCSHVLAHGQDGDGRRAPSA
jgi:hypothetical protein